MTNEYLIAANTTTADCTLESLSKTMAEFKRKFPDPPIQRVRVTQWLYDRMCKYAEDHRETQDPEPVEITRLRGLPVVVCLPAWHRPGYELDYRPNPAWGSFAEFMNPLSFWDRMPRVVTHP